MEEIKKKKKVRKPKADLPKVDLSENISETYDFGDTRHFYETVSKPDMSEQSVSKSKKTYKVICVTPSRIIYEVSKDSLSFTRNIWGTSLKAGDEIILEE